MEEQREQNKKDAFEHIYDMFGKRTKIIPTNQPDSFRVSTINIDVGYLKEYVGRKIWAKDSCSYFFEPTYHFSAEYPAEINFNCDIPYTDFLFTESKSKWYKPLEYSGSYNNFWEYVNNLENEVEDHIYLDMVSGYGHWQVSLIQEFLETGGGSSTLWKKANNTAGIKCFKHSTEFHKKAALVAIKGERNHKGCVWVGKDDHYYDHYLYFDNLYQSRLYKHKNVLSKSIYRPFDLVDYGFRFDTLLTYQIHYSNDRNKKVKYSNQKVLYGVRIPQNATVQLTPAELYALNISVGGYATDPLYADKILTMYRTFFKGWTKEDFDLFEQEMLERYYAKHGIATIGISRRRVQDVEM